VVCRGLFSLGLKCVVCFVAGVLVLSGLVWCDGAGGPRHVVGAVNGVRPQPLELPEYPEDLGVEDTAENAIRAAEYFLELMNYTQSSGDTDAYEAVSAAGCTSCHGFIDRVEELYSSGGFSVGSYTEFDGATAKRFEKSNAWQIHGDLRIGEGYRFFPNDKQPLQVVESRYLHNRWILAAVVDGQWQMGMLVKDEE